MLVLTKGRTLSMEVELFDDNGYPYELEPGEELIFSVKSAVADTEYIMQKTSTDGTFSILPEDTQPLAAGGYVYDIILHRSETDVFTVVPDPAAQEGLAYDRMRLIAGVHP